MKNTYIAYFALFISVLLGAQNIQEKGMPFVQSYLPEKYGNHGKIWEISSSPSGLVYMASENGLLEFDGMTWNRFRDYPGFSRSLHVVNDSTVYIGLDMDFGIWKKNKFRNYSYTSLYPFREKINSVNEEFWGTYQIKDQILFVSHQNFYIYRNKKIVKIHAPTRFSESFFENGRLFLADEAKGLYEYDGVRFKHVFSYPDHNYLDISGIFIHRNLFYVITKDKGIFKFENHKLQPLNLQISPEIIKNKVFTFSRIDYKYLVFGTILNGLYITDLNGRIIQHFDKNNGLPNNTVLTTYYQKNGKLWVGLDYGLVCIDIQSNITYFQNIGSNFGTGYAAALSGNTFYLGTNQGLYLADWNQMNDTGNVNLFRSINGAEGQVWTLQNIDGKILCGHNNGLFELKGNALQKIHTEPGIMCLMKYREKYLLAGTYNGISIFEKNGDSWGFLGKMKLILGAVNQIVQDKNYIWVNIPNYGLIRFSVNNRLEPENRKIFKINNFEGSFPFIFKDKEKICVQTSSSQYLFRSGNDSFISEPFQDNSDRVKNLFAGFFKPIILNSDYGFYSINNGFALENFKSPGHQLPSVSVPVFRSVKAFNNDQSKDLYGEEKLPYRFNNLRMIYIVPNEDGVQYQYFLENFSEKWSHWKTNNKVEFLGLKEGQYTLWVKARKEGKISPAQKFSFTIKAPWYRSFWGYLIFASAFGLLFYFLKNYYRNKLNRHTDALLQKEQNSLREQAEKHRQEIMLERQKQLEQEQNKLKEEIKNKTIELATKAKEGDDRNRLLQIINEKIQEAELNPNISKIKLGEMRRMLKTYMETDDHTFEIQMDELHQEFFKAMKKRFPHLSIYDLRLCAYIRVGLNSKEMADILQVLPSSINVSRSRLRKKLNLSPDEDLFDFMIKIE